MKTDQWLEEHIGHEVFKTGLERVHEVLEQLDLYPKKQKIITIGGTNGKGETSKCLSKVLNQSGVSCSLFTSPHLVSVNERFLVNEERLTEEKLLDVFTSLKSKLDKKCFSASFFEFLFYCFLEVSKEVDVLIVEVGLGGRLDCANTLDADLFLLTSISRDHQEFLGNRYDLILREKIQILRPKTIGVHTLELNYLQKLYNQQVKNTESHHYDLFSLGEVNSQQSYSLRNQKLAIFAAKKLFPQLRISFTPREKFGQREKINGARCHLLTAHNPDGVRKSVQILASSSYTEDYDFAFMSFSRRSEADCSTMIKTIKELSKRGVVKRIGLVCFKHPRAMEPERLKKLADKEGVAFYQTFPTHFEKPLSRCLVLGSHYFLGTLLS